jgi:hypothetical protein
VVVGTCAIAAPPSVGEPTAPSAILAVLTTAPDVMPAAGAATVREEAGKGLGRVEAHPLSSRCWRRTGLDHASEHQTSAPGPGGVERVWTYRRCPTLQSSPDYDST